MDKKKFFNFQAQFLLQPSINMSYLKYLHLCILSFHTKITLVDLTECLVETSTFPCLTKPFFD